VISGGEGSGDIYQTNVVVDTSGYFRVERIAMGLSPEYLTSGGEWIPQERIDVAKVTDPAQEKEWLRTTHFYNSGYTPTSIDDANQWLSELRGSIEPHIPGSAEDLAGRGGTGEPEIPEVPDLL
jgi:hypothetical protein